MRIRIDHNAKVAGELDLDKLISIMSKSQLDITKAVYESMTITKNELNWDAGYLVNVLISGIDWGVLFIGIRWRTEDEKAIKFKVCEIQYEGKVEYKKHSRTPTFNDITLSEIRKNGRAYMLINSFNPSPEHNIDMWIAKSTFPYPDDEWEQLDLGGDKDE